MLYPITRSSISSSLLISALHAFQEIEMAPLILLFYSLSLSFIQPATSDPTCQPGRTRCNPLGPEVRFPFGLDRNRCSYPGFNLSCNNLRQTILTLPNTAGEFAVQSIDYMSQTVHIKDPESCLPRRFLDSSFKLSGSPFASDLFFRSFMFLNCTSNLTIEPGSRRVRCLSNEKYAVVAVPKPSFYELYPAQLPCSVMHEVSVPVRWTRLSDSDTRLQWREPDCRSCEERGGTCRFRSDSDLSVACFNQERKGLSRAAKYGITLGLGIPSLVCFLGVASCLLSKVKAYRLRRRHPQDLEGAMSAVPQPSVTATGLDEPTIESYSKTVIGESRRLPKPDDTICSVCLSEYQPKDAIRTIPECDHYFHTDCIDEWLRMNATCPLCRKTPESSISATPSSSMSPSSSSLSPR